MRLRPLLLMSVAMLAAACTKDPQQLDAHFYAKCRDCVVSYAGGVLQSQHDTLLGVVDPQSGDTLAQEGSWKVVVKDGDNLFFRACRLFLDSDSSVVHGDIDLQISGDVKPLSAHGDTTSTCVEINQGAQAR